MAKSIRRKTKIIAIKKPNKFTSMNFDFTWICKKWKQLLLYSSALSTGKARCPLCTVKP